MALVHNVSKESRNFHFENFFGALIVGLFSEETGAPNNPSLLLAEKEFPARLGKDVSCTQHKSSLFMLNIFRVN